MHRQSKSTTIESINLDLAYEFYYAEGSYFALNYFRKEIKDYHGAGLNSGPFNGVRDVTEAQEVN